MNFYTLYGKRMLDLILSLFAMLVLTPVFALLALVVRAKLGAPILFRQIRPGRHGKPFTLYKFRTMTDARGLNGDLLPDPQRLTNFGRFLRSTSLDELPELFNVLMGEMSLVGPRPLLMRYYSYFTDEERVRFSVRPGVTGLAQVFGRNALSWDERIAKDVAYVHELSLRLDLEILARTFSSVVTRRGLHTDPGAVMLDFDEERQVRAKMEPASKV